MRQTCALAVLCESLCNCATLFQIGAIALATGQQRLSLTLLSILLLPFQIGAGVAGLQAARHLLRAGFQVMVLETASDVGGEVIRSAPYQGCPTDNSLA